MLNEIETEPLHAEPPPAATWITRVTVISLVTASTAITTATLVGVWKLARRVLAALLP